MKDRSMSKQSGTVDEAYRYHLSQAHDFVAAASHQSRVMRQRHLYYDRANMSAKCSNQPSKRAGLISGYNRGYAHTPGSAPRAARRIPFHGE